jgi:hypothetical protein
MPDITCHAKATTPFGVMAGRSRVTVTDAGQDCAVIEFHVGPTPVLLAMAESHLHAFIETLAGVCNELHRARVLAELPELPANLEQAS